MELKDLSKVWIISDTHYGHKNIVKGVSDWTDKSGCRNFKTIAEMNSFMLKEINSKVKEDDILIHLGDWSFGGIDNIWEFRKQIICKNIHLVLGNHDENIKNNKYLTNVYKEDDSINLIDKSDVLTVHDHMDYARSKDLFTSVQKYLELEIPGSKRKIICMHYPIEEWDGKSKGYFHFHGHVHENDCSSVKNRINISKELKVYNLEQLLKTIKFYDK